MTPHAKFHVNLHKGASRQISEIYANILIAIYFFFFHAPTGQTPQRKFLRAMAQTMRYQARVRLVGVRKLKLNI